MKKLLCGLVCWMSFSGLSYATGYTYDELPNTMYLTQHWVSYTTSFDIETKTKRLGTLYRRALSLPLTYDYYDNMDRLVASARARFFSISARFDVVDARYTPLGSVEEKVFSFYPSFILYSAQSDKLARAEMNFWGTNFTVYDIQTDRIMAVMSRPFFRNKNDWTIQFKDKALLTARHIDPGLFLTVLAFQADREYWDEVNNDRNSSKASAKSDKNTSDVLEAQQQIKDKIKSNVNQDEFMNVELMNTQDLEALAIQLENDYQAQAQPTDETLSSEDKTTRFIDYCLSLVHSNDISPEKKKGILYLIEQRLGGVKQDQQ